MRPTPIIFRFDRSRRRHLSVWSFLGVSTGYKINIILILLDLFIIFFFFFNSVVVCDVDSRSAPHRQVNAVCLRSEEVAVLHLHVQKKKKVTSMRHNRKSSNIISMRFSSQEYTVSFSLCHFMLVIIIIIIISI